MQKMKNSKNANATKEVKNVSAKNANNQKEVKEINLSETLENLQSKFSNYEGKEVKERQNIYIYPENVKDRSSKEGKEFRRKQRQKIQNFVDSFSLAMKRKAEQKEVEEIANKFFAHYKETYRITDFTIQSVSQSNNDVKNSKTKLFLETVKLILNK